MAITRRGFVSALLGLPVALKSILDLPTSKKPTPTPASKQTEFPPMISYVGLVGEDGREVSGNGYARMPVSSFADGAITFPTATEDWGRIAYCGCCVGQDGPPLWLIALDRPCVVQPGDITTVRII